MVTKRYLKQNGVADSWIDILYELLNKEPLLSFGDRLIAERDKVCPMADSPLRVFRMPLEDIRVVLLGQDPYPNSAANGLAFSKSKNYTKVPYSLQIMLDEISRMYGLFPPPEIDTFDMELTPWVNQGVFLLNTALTTEVSRPNAHKDLWAEFTKTIIRTIAVNNPLAIWALMGKQAQSYEPIINAHNEMPRQIVTTSHPAASRYGIKFVGNGFFTEINNALEKIKSPKINWVDG